MELIPERIHLVRDELGLRVLIDAESRPIYRIARAFPDTNPDHFIGLIDDAGHEIGLIEDPERLDEASRILLDSELKEIYFIPAILGVRSVTQSGTGSQWEVRTDDGDYSFRVLSRESLDGSYPPSIMIMSETGKRFYIDNYWAMGEDSRNVMASYLPDKVLKFRYSLGSMSLRSGGQSSSTSTGGHGHSHHGRHSTGGGMMSFR